MDSDSDSDSDIHADEGDRLSSRNSTTDTTSPERGQYEDQTFEFSNDSSTDTDDSEFSSDSSTTGDTALTHYSLDAWSPKCWFPAKADDGFFSQQKIGASCTDEMDAYADWGNQMRMEDEVHQAKNVRQAALKTLGISIHELRYGFLASVEASPGLSRQSTIYELEDLRLHDRPGLIRRKGLNKICPLDGKMGTSYIHALDPELVGPADFMLSYSWGYQIGDIADALWDHCVLTLRRDPKRTYVWMCCLGVNQHRVVENIREERDVSFEEFESLFKTRVYGIGHVLAMLAPWNSPIYLKRVWCIFEFLTATLNYSPVKLTFLLSEKERQAMLNALESDETLCVEQLYKALENTSVMDAQASREEDKRMIMEKVDGELQSGNPNLGLEARNRLREWATKTVASALGERIYWYRNGQRQPPAAAHFYLNVGATFQHFKSWKSALKCCRLALEFQIATLGENHADTTRSLAAIGALHLERHDHVRALQYAGKCIAILEGTVGLDNLNGATAYWILGTVEHSKRNLSQALEYHQKSLEIRRSTLSENHPTTTISLCALASVLQAVGDYKASLEMFEKTARLQETLLGTTHPLLVTTYTHMTSLLIELGNYEGATGYHDEEERKEPRPLEKAWDICSTLWGFETKTTKQYDRQLLGCRIDDCHHRFESASYKLGCDRWLRPQSAFQQAQQIEHTWLAAAKSGRLPKRARPVKNTIIPELKRAISIRRKLFGESTMAAALACKIAAYCFNGAGCSVEGLKHLRGSLLLQEVSLGADHPDLVDTLVDIANALSIEGDKEGASKNFERAIHIAKGNLASTARLHHSFGTFQQHNGNLDGAHESFQRSLKIRLSLPRCYNVETARTLFEAGRVSKARGDWSLALECLSKSIATLKGDEAQVLDRPHWTPFKTRQVCGVYVVATLVERGDLLGAKIYQECMAERPESGASAVRKLAIDLERELGEDHPKTIYTQRRAQVLELWQYLKGKAPVADYMESFERQFCSFTKDENVNCRIRSEPESESETVEWYMIHMNQFAKSIQKDPDLDGSPFGSEILACLQEKFGSCLDLEETTSNGSSSEDSTSDSSGIRWIRR